MNIRSYALVTGAYWVFTITDGALRMLVLLHFHELGHSPLTLAFLFLLYEFMGIVTNLVGGWIGSRIGLNITLYAGLALQVVALSALSFVDESWAQVVSVAFVMGTQALSGVAKDLTKMSSKSAVKFFAKGDDAAQQHSTLFKWVAVLTGSKNALKGVGFFIGGALLSWVGFKYGLWVMAGGVALALLFALAFLRENIGKTKAKVPFKGIFSKSSAINRLSLARFFLFGARDVWFVVGLPVFLHAGLGWDFWTVGGFMAAWVIGYGIVQASAPSILKRTGAKQDEVGAARAWVLALMVVSLLISIAVQWDLWETAILLGGLIVFGVVFAMNSSIHSFLILAYTEEDDVALNVGFYYMANACGRLGGTLISGLSYMLGGLEACLWASSAFVVASWALSRSLPPMRKEYA